MLCWSDVSPFHGALSLLHFLILQCSERNTGGMKAPLFPPKHRCRIERNYLRLFLFNSRENYPNLTVHFVKERIVEKVWTIALSGGWGGLKCNLHLFV